MTRGADSTFASRGTTVSTTTQSQRLAVCESSRGWMSYQVRDAAGVDDAGAAPTTATGSTILDPDHYVATGNVDGQPWIAWPGGNIIACMKAAEHAMRGALVSAVKSRENNVRMPSVPPPDKLVALTRSRVEPMVRALFPADEQDVVLALLEKSVVFVTPGNIEQLLHDEEFDGDAWHVANLFLFSIRAPLLSEDAPRMVGLSEATTCFVSPEYLDGRGKFDEFLVHETAHIFHNWKRAYAGLPKKRRKEWLLEIEFRKRETFAYSCEVYARILEQGHTAKSRVALVEEYAQHPFTDVTMDVQEHVDILRAAVRAGNGWKRILERCAPNRGRIASHQTT